MERTERIGSFVSYKDNFIVGSRRSLRRHSRRHRRRRREGCQEDPLEV